MTKNTFFRILTVCVLGSILVLSACKSDSPATLSKQDDVKAKLTSGAWKVSTVTVDNVDKTTTYQNLAITFTNTGFSSTNGGVIWPATGTWTFNSTDATAITRNDGLVVTLTEVTSTSLKLGLNWTKTTLGGGRVESVSGQHVFTFTK